MRFEASAASAQRETRVDPSSPASEAAASVPNWRVLRVGKVPVVEGGKDDRHNGELLNRRREWSKAQFDAALDLYVQLTRCDDSYVQPRIESALHCLDHAFRLYRPDSVVCSFNGGKDAVVILHLMRAALANYVHEQNSRVDERTQLVNRPRVIYFEHDDEFPEMLQFLRETVDRYDLDMVGFERGVKFPDGLSVLVRHNKRDTVPLPMAFVLGTRSGDPNAGSQGTFAPSSHYMPPFMRVNPILDWSYGHVWHFLRLFQLPYCPLYDRGYTSLGTTKDTLPCPALAVAGGGGDGDAGAATTRLDGSSANLDLSERSASSVPKYWPAYMLRDWDQERAGRIPKDKIKKASAGVTVPVAPISRANSSSADRLSTFSHVRGEDPNDDLRDPDLVASSVQPSDDTDSVTCVSYGNGGDEDFVSQKTVGLLVIGDEILKGYTADTNTQAAAKALRDQNVLLRRVVVVSDDQEEIVNEIRRLQREVDVIITSGGVGPTHDDVTIKSVAAALGCELVLHEGMAQLLRDKMNGGDTAADLTEAQVKMATLPRSSKLRYLSESPKDWPVLQCRNVFILPGIPEFFSAKIENVSKYLSCQLERGAAYKVVLSVDENSIVSTLNQVVEKHPNVSFGSYPFVSHPEFKTVITVEGRLIGRGGRSNSVVFERSTIENPKGQLGAYVERALDELLTTLPEGSILRVDNDDMLLYS